jgi:hypothetical protein
VCDLERDLGATEAELCDERESSKAALNECKKLENLLKESSRCLEESRCVFGG